MAFTDFRNHPYNYRGYSQVMTDYGKDLRRDLLKEGISGIIQD